MSTSTRVRRLPTTLVLAALLAATTAATVAAAPSSAPEAPAVAWADADVATIHPGVQTISGGQCTANFVFTDRSGGVYLGQAAHCSGTGAQTDTNGCTTGSLELGLPVEVQGAEHPATLVYSSWITMQKVGETSADACADNDFALVRLHPADVANVNPSIPVLGGPVGLTNTVSVGSRVNSYGNSGLRLGLAPTSPKTGITLGQSASGWTHTVYTVSPGIPGDSGSGFVDNQGRAFGVLSTLAIFPYAASNGVTDLALALSYANRFGGMDVQLALGTEPFTGMAGPQVPLGTPTAPTSGASPAGLENKGVAAGNLL